MPASITRKLITGGAGFVGSHLVDRLMQAGEEVIYLDNFLTDPKLSEQQMAQNLDQPAGEGEGSRPGCLMREPGPMRRRRGRRG